MGRRLAPTSGMNTHPIRCIAGALAVLMGCASAFAAGAGDRKLVVGLQFLFDNKFNYSVNAVVEGIEFAKTDFERQNPGYKIDLKRYAHGDDLASAVRASRLAVADDVAAVIGGERTEEALVMGEILNEGRIVFMTPTASNPKVTENRPFVFRGCFSDEDVAARLVKFVTGKLKATQVGVIHNVSSPYSNYISKKFVAELAELDQKAGRKTNVTVAKILKGAFDFDPVVEDFMAKGITHVVILDHGGDILRFSAQASARGFHPVYIGSDGWGSSEQVHTTFVKESTFGQKFTGYVNSYWQPESRLAAVQNFKRSFRKMFRKDPDSFHAIAYDTAMVLFTAMREAGPGADGDAVRRSLRRIQMSQLVTTDHFSFDDTNSPKKPLHMYRVDQSGIKLEETLR